MLPFITSFQEEVCNFIAVFINLEKQMEFFDKLGYMVVDLDCKVF